ncbi:molybdate ABC transporter substrate-binding protein [Olivibacter sitiensis]|uniref:molybdate ABC transporter substrate-binding protein n=1 Tax=Olivibacter sitiensis TaxID=376470 RepID=UPI00042513A3|nr:molybdate ABC transporter substrate-binding protein [Olivibacter sitiensis]
MRRICWVFFWVFACCFFQWKLLAQPLRLAVSANAQFVIGQLQSDFQERTGIATEAIISSSGKLAAQILNGAPYDLFLSADMYFPEKVAQAGFGLTAVKVYAYGRLIVASQTIQPIAKWEELLKSGRINKLAIADPKLAPYGKAAEEVLKHYGLLEKVTPKLVYGESISQVNIYLTNGAVDLAFTTEALVHEGGNKHRLYWARVDESLYSKIEQGVLICQYAKGNRLEQAKAFLDYLSSASAKRIFQDYGYQVPIVR